MVKDQNSKKIMIDITKKKELIDRYVARQSERTKKELLSDLKIALIILAVIFYALTIIWAAIDYPEGMTSAKSTAFLALSIPLALLAIAGSIMHLYNTKKLKNDSERLRKKLNETTYSINEEGLVRDDHRKKRFDTGKISQIEEEDGIVTFRYYCDEYTILDFYDPPIYEKLVRLTENN